MSMFNLLIIYILCLFLIEFFHEIAIFTLSRIMCKSLNLQTSGLCGRPRSASKRARSRSFISKILSQQRSYTITAIAFRLIRTTGIILLSRIRSFNRNIKITFNLIFLIHIPSKVVHVGFQIRHGLRFSRMLS